MVSYLLLVEPGAMAEWLKALVLKTSDTERYRGFESLSLRSPAMEKYPSGRRGSPAKGVVRVTAARVQIPASPLLEPLRTIVLKGFLYSLSGPPKTWESSSNYRVFFENRAICTLGTSWFHFLDGIGFTE